MSNSKLAIVEPDGYLERDIKIAEASLPSWLTEAEKANHAHGVATVNAPGFMSPEDKLKLDTIDIKSNLALAPDNVPYVLIGANAVTIYQGTDGNFYFTEV
jgi:hypothetical protein